MGQALFVLVSFGFQFEFFFDVDFQMHKTYLKSFVFKILFFVYFVYLFNYNVRPFISMITKFEVYNVFSF